MLNDNPFEVAFGIIVLIGMIAMFVSFVKNQIKFNKKMDNLEKNNPKYKEKIRVYRSRKGFVKEKVFDKSKLKYYIPVLIIVIIIYSIIYTDLQYMINSKIIGVMIFMSLFAIITLIKMSLKARTLDAINYVEQAVKNKYGVILKNPMSPTEIIYKEKSELGNVRSICIFSYNISKYNCIFENYHYEELQRRVSASESFDYQYIYVKIKNVVKYFYNLEEIGILQNINSIMVNEEIVRTINELSDIKFINVSVVNKCLIIEKETVLHGYNKNDAYRDAYDVELLYNTLIKKMLEVNSYGSHNS